MISSQDLYRQIITTSIHKHILIPNYSKQPYHQAIQLSYDQVLPSFYILPESTYKIHKNEILTHEINSRYILPTKNINKNSYFPYSCIGLVLSQHQQNEKVFNVYGTGILIHNNIILTNAETVYCRRLHREYKNIKFIPGLDGKIHSGFYYVKKFHYPMQYTEGYDYKKYNFAILQLYDDLSHKCGSIGWKTIENDNNLNVHIYKYLRVGQNNFFELREFQNNSNQEYFLKFISLQAENGKNSFYIYDNSQQGFVRNTINQWTATYRLDLEWKQLGGQLCRYLSEPDLKNLKQINLYQNRINPVGCKYLNSWIDLTNINLAYNNIGSEGCKILKQKYWNDLIAINLSDNNIGAQGCFYLKDANWIHLTTINLSWNNIGAQGCKYLKDTNWLNLVTINLSDNNINTEGCMYLKDTKWIYLMHINLIQNLISDQGCMYLKDAMWIHLTSIDLGNNKIGSEGFNQLKDAKWIHLSAIDLVNNNINAEGCRFLIDTKWNKLAILYIGSNNIHTIGSKYLSATSWENLICIGISWNNIGTQGCKFLKEGNWPYLTTIDLQKNEIGIYGLKYLKDTNWKNLININLNGNSIEIQSLKYLKDVNWPHLMSINLYSNLMGYEIIAFQMMLKQLWPVAKIQL